MTQNPKPITNFVVDTINIDKSHGLETNSESVSVRSCFYFGNGKRDLLLILQACFVGIEEK